MANINWTSILSRFGIRDTRVRGSDLEVALEEPLDVKGAADMKKAGFPYVGQRGRTYAFSLRQKRNYKPPKK